MSRAACKVLENNGLRALSISLERILTEPNLNGGKISDSERIGLIQKMADIDKCVYHGGTIECGYLGIMKRLEELDILSPDIWNVYTCE